MVLRHPSALTVLLSFAFTSSSALAGRPRAGAPPAPPPVVESHPGGEAGAYAEERFHAGDCAGALDAFDQALRTAVSPELQRDRGICHDKLGHPFPAIDDYRAYLQARPDAADADHVRGRLEALEAQAGVVKPVPRGSGSAVTVSGGAEVGFGTGAKGASLDVVESNEALDQEADASSLRRGRGFALAVHIDVAHYGSSSFGWAEGAGLDLRYSLSRVSTLLLGFQYMDVNASGASSSMGGPGFIAGYEARLALDARVGNALLLGATFGYESLSQSATGYAFNVIEPKVRVGYRHVFGPTFGVEASFDGGPAWVSLSGAPAGASATTSTSLLGGHVGVVLGF